MQRYVIHVVTKDLCTSDSLFAPKLPLAERLQSALRLRQQFDLPDLAIEPSVLLEALNPMGLTRMYSADDSELDDMDAPTHAALI